ncbi:hypothetical protein [Microbispora sp. H13382]|uniref:hypothetical protein n=1 Tax=Microbispora sp. H13382 TaxID=2729112 RepID=UPI0016012A4F|nr:hypothetical protein [Microbispora sp. H13382]
MSERIGGHSAIRLGHLRASGTTRPRAARREGGMRSLSMRVVVRGRGPGPWTSLEVR